LTKESLAHSEVDPYSPFLVERNEYSFAPQVLLHSDLEVFIAAMAAYEASLPILENSNSGTKAYTQEYRRSLSSLKSVYECCSGDFLHGIHSKWVSINQRHLEKQYVRALSALYTMLTEMGKMDAFSYLLIAFQRHSTHSEIVKLIMTACYGKDNAEIAWMYYRFHRAALAKEGKVPSEEVTALYDEYNLKRYEKR
jgi:DNA-binding SARP family transcriptional activator